MVASATIKAVGDWDAQMAVPLSTALNVAVDAIGKTGRQACGMALVKMAQSARSFTKQSPKLRPVVRNPDSRWRTDRRRAPFGVMRFRGDRSTYFVPIYRTGQFGTIRFFDKRTAAFYDRGGPKGNRWTKVASGPDIANPEIVVPGIMRDRRRIIGRRGLAKKSWMWGLKGLRGAEDFERSDAGYMPDVAYNIEHVTDDECGFILTNKLRYIYHAAPENVQQIAAKSASNTIMATAARRLEQQNVFYSHRLRGKSSPGRTTTLAEAWAAAR